MKRTFYNVLPVFSIIILLSLISCKQKEEQQRQNFISSEAPDLTKEELKTVHKDTNYKYEYRTGKSGDYEYNYDVSGTDNEGNKVSGTVYVNGKYGEPWTTDQKKNAFFTTWAEQQPEEIEHSEHYYDTERNK